MIQQFLSFLSEKGFVETTSPDQINEGNITDTTAVEIHALRLMYEQKDNFPSKIMNIRAGGGKTITSFFWILYNAIRLNKWGTDGLRIRTVCTPECSSNIKETMIDMCNFFKVKVKFFEGGSILD